jgi:hypothetical protein
MGWSWSGINGRHWHDDTLKNKLYFCYYL